MLNLGRPTSKNNDWKLEQVLHNIIHNKPAYAPLCLLLEPSYIICEVDDFTAWRPGNIPCEVMLVKMVAPFTGASMVSK